MPKKSKDDRDQKQRFVDVSRAVGADESGIEFEKAFAKIVSPKRSRIAPKDQQPKAED